MVTNGGDSPFGNRLRALRREAGLRQIDVATILDVGRSTLANIERSAERPSERIWSRLQTSFPEWVSELREAFARARAQPVGGPPDGLTDEKDGGPPEIGGPFTIESVSYVYVFGESRSPGEIIVIRKVRATKSGVRAYGLKFEHMDSNHFAVEEEVLWGGSTVRSVRETDSGHTEILSRLDFGRALKRGQAHEFAVRTWVERDDDPATQIVFNVTIPTREASIHVAFHGRRSPAELWTFGPVDDDPPETPAGFSRLLLNGGTATFRVRGPQLGRVYGLGWDWGRSG